MTEVIDPMATTSVTTEQSAAISADLPKVGKTIAKILQGIADFFGGTIIPALEPIIVKVLTSLAQAYADKIMKKNGVNL